jgi:magnesium transporter
MFKLKFDTQKKNIGKAPGDLSSLVANDSSAKIFAYIYNKHNAELMSDINISALNEISYDDQVVWLEFEKFLSAEQVDYLQEKFEIDNLIFEDILTNNHRPKIEIVDQYFFMVLRLPIIKGLEVLSQQFSIVLKNNVLISFLDEADDVFAHIKKRIFKYDAKLRSYKEDFLFYLLLDAVVDKYFVALSVLNAKYESLMDNVDRNVNIESQKELQNLKHEILNLKRNILSLKEIINRIINGEINVIDANLQRYLQDLQEQINHANESAEMLREMILSLIELANINLSNRMNEVMKFLTMISTIFIPISFIAGLYGMNFTNMPELANPNGYYFTLALMGILALAMFVFFKFKKWF